MRRRRRQFSPLALLLTRWNVSWSVCALGVSARLHELPVCLITCLAAFNDEDNQYMHPESSSSDGDGDSDYKSGKKRKYSQKPKMQAFALPPPAGPALQLPQTSLPKPPVSNPWMLRMSVVSACTGMCCIRGAVTVFCFHLQLTRMTRRLTRSRSLINPLQPREFEKRCPPKQVSPYYE